MRLNGHSLIAGEQFIGANGTACGIQPRHE